MVFILGGWLLSRHPSRRAVILLTRAALSLLVLVPSVAGQNTPGLGAAPSGAPQSAPSGSFVTREGAQLQLNGAPFYFTGANFYSAMVNAAGGEFTRAQTTAVFQMMQDLGLTVMRTWAFNDYGVNNTWQALQTSPQVFNESVFSQGLDWIISEAPKYGVKLLLTLTNYQLGYGGAYQYVKWANGTNILDFYTNPTIQRWYQNNVRTIVTRENSITGVQYKDDPAIFGWELINEPHVPGDDSGNILTDWIGTNSAYLRSLDGNHLIGVGVEGFYGQSTASKLSDNPTPGMTSTSNGGNPAPYAAICEGQDFSANHQSEDIDFTSIHLYPDFWATGNLTFQMDFTSTYVLGHMEESAKLQKPLVIGEFGKYPPLSDRNKFLSAVYSLAAASASSGDVLAGTMVWTLGTTPEFPYVNGFDAFNIYPQAAQYAEAPKTGFIPPTQAAGVNAANTEFFGWANQTACNAKYVTNPKGLLSAMPSPSSGWNETLSIIRQAALATAGQSGASGQFASQPPLALSG